MNHCKKHKNNSPIVFMLCKNAIDFMKEHSAVELHIDDENRSRSSSSPIAQSQEQPQEQSQEQLQVESLESSMSTYDSMLQTLNDELNDRITDATDIEFECLDFFNMDCATAMSFDYEMNYTIKQLKHVAGYYGIKCKSKKADMIQDIVAYEIDTENCDTVIRRKRMFHYMNALKTDDYFKSFVIM